MSLITRCPACGTLFKVVADQLKISQGWVRCGQCAEVFDAQAQMAKEASAQSAPVPLQAETAIVFAEPTEKTAEIGKTAPDGTSTDPGAHADFADSNWYTTVNPPAPQSLSNFVDSVAPSALSSQPGEAGLAAVSADSLPPGRQAVAEPSALVNGVPAALPAGEVPGFVLQAQRTQRWRSPWVRALLLLLGVALLATLAAQIAVQERDRVAAQEPRALPWLKQLCAAVGCSVGPLKQIESVVVDASSFNKLRGDGKFDIYKLALSLKNTSALSVAVPHIELSLNDAQDQPVLRRVLNPADLGTAHSVLAPAAELAGSSTIQVDSSQLAGARIAGYRLWAFYP